MHINLSTHESDSYLVIYDGVCNFCNGAVKFIYKRDPFGRFSFCPIQSEYARQRLKELGQPFPREDTFMLVKEGRVYYWSAAALEITRHLTGFWYLFRIFSVLPAKWRDPVYMLFARNRIRLFGGTKVCQLPPQDMLKRFKGLPLD